MTHEETCLKTRTALAASLKKHMAKKALRKITVSEIITDCNVNRKTFYYHFEDIYALLKWMLEQEAIEVVKHFDLSRDYENAIPFIIEYVHSNAHILNCAYDSMGRDEMKRFFYNDFVDIARNVIDDCEEQCGLKIQENFKDFLCHFLTEAVAGLLVDSFKCQILPDQDEVMSHVSVMFHSLPDILKRAPQAESAS